MYYCSVLESYELKIAMFSSLNKWYQSQSKKRRNIKNVKAKERNKQTNSRCKWMLVK